MDSPESGELPDVAALLALLAGAEDSFSTVRTTYRVWRHRARMGAAFRAHMDVEKQRGLVIGTVRGGRPSEAAGAGEERAPEREKREPEHEELVRIWRAGDRCREEFESRGGRYWVRNGLVWWSWDQANGALSNAGNSSPGGGTGELAIMLDPAGLLDVLRFKVTGRATVAGRAAITATGLPRDDRPAGPSGPWFRLNSIGNGADRYDVAVDEQLGVLLSTVAVRNGEAFYAITTIDVVFDEAIPGERFEFVPPPGAEIRSLTS